MASSSTVGILPFSLPASAARASARLPAHILYLKRSSPTSSLTAAADANRGPPARGGQRNLPKRSERPEVRGNPGDGCPRVEPGHRSHQARYCPPVFSAINAKWETARIGCHRRGTIRESLFGAMQLAAVSCAAELPRTDPEISPTPGPRKVGQVEGAGASPRRLHEPLRKLGRNRIVWRGAF